MPQTSAFLPGFKVLLATLVVVLGAHPSVGATNRCVAPSTPNLSPYPWLYLRDGEPLAAGERVVELIAVGDVMPGRGVAGETQPLAAATPWLRKADLVLGNLECVIAEGGTPRPEPYRLGFSCERSPGGGGEGCYPVDLDQISQRETLPGGAIDLTGDGIPEQVRLAGRQVIVYRGGVEVWQSPSEWCVVDLALGDPNDDGRGELLLALWKSGGVDVRDDSSELKVHSHPFVIGYRGGAYRILWGGSAVVEPIHEVEVADVDGDGVQELVVLEGHVDGLECTIGVWRWHGWGFSLLWRSPPGHYGGLVLIPREAGSPPVIGVSEER